MFHHAILNHVLFSSLSYIVLIKLQSTETSLEVILDYDLYGADCHLDSIKDHLKLCISQPFLTDINPTSSEHLMPLVLMVISNHTGDMLCAE